MRYNASCAQKAYKKLSLIWMMLVIILLSSMFIAACAADAGVNGNASSNGVGNGNTGVCNGSNVCNGIGNSGSGSGQQPAVGNQNTSSNPPAEPRPQSADEIANKLGGDVSGWSTVGPNGWVYRGGAETSSFTVPHWCVVDTSDGRFYPGAQIPPLTALTIYYNVSSYDLQGHSP